VTFSGIEQGDRYEIGTGSNTFNAVDVVDVTGKFDLGVFALGTTNQGHPLNLSYDLNITDGDGDSVSVPGAIAITLDPAGTVGSTPIIINNSVINNSVSTQSTSHIALSSTSLMPSNDNGEHQRAFSVGGNAALMGAFAAAGLEAEQLSMGGHQAFSGPSLAQGMTPLENVAAASVAGPGHSIAQPAQMQAMPVMDGSHAVQQGGQVHDMVEAAHPLVAGHPVQPLQMSELLHGSNGPGHAVPASASAVTAAAVMMPSAQQLAAATGSQPHTSVAGNAQHDQVVGKVLADALHGGAAHSPTIDALVNSLPGHAGGGNAALQALASHGGAAVSIEHMAMAGPFGGPHSMLSVDMVMHQDAPPPAHG
jgi:hypothetical protein